VKFIPDPNGQTMRNAYSLPFDMKGLHSPRRRSLLAAGAGAALLGACSSPASADGGALAKGVVWQVDEDHLNPRGDWDRLGVTDLLVQWSAVDNTSFLPVGGPQAAAGLQAAARLPDWQRIGREPWARNVILGLAGRFDETTARAQVAHLVEQSRMLTAMRPAVHIDGYYFPVEVDPTWQGALALGPLLYALPRPLWISVYDNTNIGGAALAAWLDTWLPRDVGVFFQDGCGVYARGPAAAKSYAEALVAKLGKQRVRIIAEAFRPAGNNTFRAATAAELAPQLFAYRGYRTYLFDGPHYVSTQLVQGLLDAQAAQK
jgi:hypothetical protein